MCVGTPRIAGFKDVSGHVYTQRLWCEGCLSIRLVSWGLCDYNDSSSCCEIGVSTGVLLPFEISGLLHCHL